MHLGQTQDTEVHQSCHMGLDRVPLDPESRKVPAADTVDKAAVWHSRQVLVHRSRSLLAAVGHSAAHNGKARFQNLPKNFHNVHLSWLPALVDTLVLDDRPDKRAADIPMEADK